VLVRALVDGSSGKVPIRVANPTTNAVTVYKDSHVGSFHPLQSQDRELVTVHSCQLSKTKTNTGSTVPLSERVIETKTEGKILNSFDVGDLTEPQRGQWVAVLVDYQDVFPTNPGDIGITSKYSIESRQKTLPYWTGTTIVKA
jgi:hypothetical protein